MDVARRSRARWILLAEIGLVAVAIVLSVPDPGAIAIALVGVPIVVYGWLGARISESVPDNRVGWLLSTAAIAAAAGVIGGAYRAFGSTHPGSDLPWAEVVGVLVDVVTPTTIGLCLLLVVLSFPTGTLPSPRWRPVPWAVVATAVLAVLAGLGDPGSSAARTFPTLSGAVPFRDSLADVVVITAAVLFLICVASLFVRSRNAPPDQRREIRGLLVTLVLMAAMVPPFAISVGQEDGWFVAFITGGLFAIGFLVAIPFTLSISMLRYGLFDYEVGIRKTIARAMLVVATVLISCVVLFVVVSAFAGRGARPDPREGIVIGIAAGVVLMLVVRWSHGFADRVVFRGRATPYEVLSEFSGRVAETYALDDVLPRMAIVLANGTGAAVARIWLDVDGRLRPVATVPPDASDGARLERDGDAVWSSDPTVHVFPVRQQGIVLGALALTMPPNDPMNVQKVRLVEDVARQAGLVLHNVGLLEVVRESRRRIVTAQDARARSLERNIHDGAQQQLIALTVKLGLAEQLVERDPTKARELLGTLRADATDALEDLRDLARGIYPPLLADEGLGAALEAQARKSPDAVTVVTDGIGRYSQEIESAVYFSCLEALQNVAKYAAASRVTIQLAETSDELRFEVDDDGRGFDTTVRRPGTGLRGILDRLEAVGGALIVRSVPGSGTTVVGTVPVDGPGA